MAATETVEFMPWPADLAAQYRAAGYWQSLTLSDALRSWAARSGDRIAVVCGARRWSYRELDRRVDRLAAGLIALGIQPGQRAVVQLPNRAEWLVVFFALIRAGVVFVHNARGNLIGFGHNKKH